MTRIFAILWLLASVAFAATGDVTAVVLSDGWRVRVTVEGFTTGATVNMGLGGTDGTTVSAATPYLTVTSEGFTGPTLGTKTRTSYLGAVMRFPWTTRAIPGSYTSGTFVRHENVTGSVSGAVGVMVGDQSTGSVLYLTSLSATPDATDVFTGGTSGATFAASGAGSDTANPSWDQRVVGGNLVLEFALSQTVYVGDNTGAGNSGTAPTLTAPAGWITNTGGASQTSNAASAATITNSSAVTYRKVKFWWMWPDYQLVSDQVYPRAFAWAPHGHNGKPGIECVVFEAAEGMNTVTGDPVYRLEKDYSMPQTEFRKACVPTFIDILSTSALTQGATCTLNATVYPQIGDTPYATASNTLLPESLYGTQSFLCDKTGAYGRTHAVADSVSGSDPAGVAVGDDAGKWVGNGTDPTAGSGPYATIARAARSVRNYNNANRSRDDVGGGIVYLKAGNYAGLGATISGGYGSVPATYISIEPYPGVARADVVINAEAGDNDISDRVKLHNIKITSATNSTFNGILQLWVNQCEINSATNAPFTGTNMVGYMTHCKVTDLDQGIRKASATATMMWAIVRGNEFAGFNTPCQVVGAVVGNFQDTKYASITRFEDRDASYTGPDGTALLAFNNILGWNATGSGLALSFAGVSESDTEGFSILQNVFEATENVTAGLGDVAAAEGVNNYPITDCNVQYNTFVGQRMQFAYNSDTAVLKPRYNWEVAQNVWDVMGFKDDDFLGVAGDGIRQGPWPIAFGANCWANVNISNDDITQSFPPDFIGLNGYEGSPGTNDSTWPAFKNRQAAAGGTATGMGDYSLQPTSPLRNRQTAESFRIPFDMAGRRRRAVDASGAYSQHKSVGRGMF